MVAANRVRGEMDMVWLGGQDHTLVSEMVIVDDFTI